MGLDMYLGRVKKNSILTPREMSVIDLDELKETHPKTFKKLLDENIIVERGEHYKYFSFAEDVGYWRKANAIHNWFVENVQGGIDECDQYEVPKTKIIELLDICKEVLNGSNLISGKVHNGTSWSGGVETKHIEDGKVIEDSSIAEMLLPSTSGFFFGNTDYNEWYMEDIKSTIEILEKVLSDTDFSTHYITYQSSW